MGLQHKWVVTKPPPPNPTDYFVPNFGRDREIIDAFDNLSATEEAMKHKWNWVLRPKDDFNKDKGVPPY